MPKVNANTVYLLIKKALAGRGAPEKIAHHVAEGLVSTSLRGVDSHGIRVIQHYLAEVESGRTNPNPDYKIIQRKPTCAILDADHTFGHAAGMEGAELAVKLAKEYGSGHVAIANSTHFGAAAYYGLYMAEQGMLGFSLTHSDSLVIPTRSKKSFLGNNPLCFTAPIEGEGPFCLDMATSQITFNEVRRLRATGGTAPMGVGADRDGHLTTDPNDICMLTPIASYKGYGMGVMIEILCSMLTGMPYGPHISKMFVDLDKKRHLAHYVSAIDISAFQELDAFKARMKTLVDELRQEPPLDENLPVLVAGDPEKRSVENRSLDGIPLAEEDYRFFVDLHEKMGLTESLTP